MGWHLGEALESDGGVKQHLNTPSLTKAQWKLIKPLLPQERRGRPRRISQKRILDAIWFVVVTGLQWRYLPSTYPCWQTVYYHFRRWCQKGYWRRIYQALRVLERQRQGRHKQASAGCLDSQSVKTGRAGGVCGFDAAKHIKGRKRHLLSDTLGLPMEILVSAASVSENAGAQSLFRRAGRRRGTLRRLHKVWVDGGYKAGLLKWCRSRYGVELEVVKTPAGQRGFQVQPRRWVVERCFAWLSPCRRLCVDHERKTITSENMMWIAYTRLLLKRLA